MAGLGDEEGRPDAAKRVRQKLGRLSSFHF
jgi:hypothetical protein